MGWKERYFARTDVVTKLVVLPATVLVSVFLVLAVGIDESILRAFADLWNGGLRGWGGGEALVEHVRVASAWYVAIWLLAVAGASASSVAVEREEDTWTSLTSTPLTGWEILRGKVLGALWAQRGFGAVPLGLWTIGLLTGSVHPLGFLGTLLAFGLITWLVVAVGIHASLRATSTSKALTSTIVTLAVFYGYPVFLLGSFVFSGVWNTYGSFVGLPTRIVVGPLVSYHQLGQIWWRARTNGITEIPGFGDIFLGVMLLLLYTSVAALLTARSVVRFDRWLDRPSLSVDAPVARKKPADVLDEVEALIQS
jgi:hypothetical protein